MNRQQFYNMRRGYRSISKQGDDGFANLPKHLDMFYKFNPYHLWQPGKAVSKIKESLQLRRRYGPIQPSLVTKIAKSYFSRTY